MQARIDGSTLVTRRSWRANIFEAWGHRCAYCNAPAESLDHVQPSSRGGLTIVTNLVPACLTCNRRKGDSNVLDWFRSQPFWSAAAEQRLLDWIA